MFKGLYDSVVRLSRHRHAPKYLAIVSFAESSFFPVPPDVMLAPMVLGNRKRAWRLAGLTTLASVAGGILGYYLGGFGEWLVTIYGAHATLAQAQQWFADYGLWIILVAGFTPVPYKIFTISAGMMGMSLVTFVVASIIGRGARFFLVAGFIYFAGTFFATDEDLINVIRRYIDLLGWVMIALVVTLFILLR
jgi:membrane protein YqaA with SNARE-associated domain|tara:strand:+ start:1454 stop:2029 length:576 start_codon:yes stop_codon:yes gene_type:complete